MKTFADLKPGDKMYYYDHGKIREQIVYDVKIENEEYKYTNWYGNEHIEIRKWVVITAGNGCIYKLRDWHAGSGSDTYFRYMKRFACIEAVNNFIDYRIHRDEYKIKQAQKQLNKYEKLIKKHLAVKSSINNN